MKRLETYRSRETARCFKGDPLTAGAAYIRVSIFY